MWDLGRVFWEGAAKPLALQRGDAAPVPIPGSPKSLTVLRLFLQLCTLGCRRIRGGWIWLMPEIRVPKHHPVLFAAAGDVLRVAVGLGEWGALPTARCSPGCSAPAPFLLQRWARPRALRRGRRQRHPRQSPCRPPAPLPAPRRRRRRNPWKMMNPKKS